MRGEFHATTQRRKGEYDAKAQRCNDAKVSMGCQSVIGSELLLEKRNLICLRRMKRANNYKWISGSEMVYLGSS